MSVFIHVEVAAREIDSKVLLAVLAAERGHTVLLGDVIGGAENPFFEPGIFHTKSVGVSPKLLLRHGKIRRLGHKITSQDEEAHLQGEDCTHFAASRFSEEALGLVSGVFAWGGADYDSLKSLYPDHAEKFHLTGSPRADLWIPTFKEYWPRLGSFPAKPFLLISSNLGIPRRSLGEQFSALHRSGYFAVFPDAKAHLPIRWARTFRMLNAFVEAIRFLSDAAEGYEIVLRPHPGESAEVWEQLLDGLSNVHVIRDKPINHWVHGAFAVMHNGCTTALETVIGERPLITFLPFREDKTPGSVDMGLANSLGVPVRGLPELQLAVQRFLAMRLEGEELKIGSGDIETVAAKVFRPSSSLSGELIVDLWDQLVEPDAPSKLRVYIFWLALLAKRLRRALIRMFPASPAAASMKREDEKFPPIDIKDLRQKVVSLQQILGLRETVRCTLVGEKTVLIKPTS